jgi:hypothetical protein
LREKKLGFFVFYEGTTAAGIPLNDEKFGFLYGNHIYIVRKRYEGCKENAQPKKSTCDTVVVPAEGGERETTMSISLMESARSRKADGEKSIRRIYLIAWKATPAMEAAGVVDTCTAQPERSKKASNH